MIKLRQILTTLLSVYLLVLMVFPCSDAHASHATPSKLRFEKRNDSHSEHDNHICTPFCVCGSCIAAVVVNQPFEMQLFIPANASVQEPVFYKLLQSSFKGAIWQPPQLL